MESRVGSESWEVVGAKKSGKAAEPMSKSKKKSIREKMPTIQPSAPVEESSTIYEAFIKNEERKEEKKALLQQRQAANQNSPSAVGKKNAPAVKKENKVEKKKEKPVSLEEAVGKIDVKKFEQWLEKTKQTFPDHPDIWLKDLASLLNLELGIVIDNDPVFSNKPTGYPLSKLPRRVQDLMYSTLKKASVEVVADFVLHCLHKLLEEQSRGSPTIGYRMFIQLVLTSQPQAVVNHLDTYLDVLKQNVNRPIRALSILWSVGQVGLSSLTCGLRVWLDIMLPVMDMRSLSNYCMLYLENLLRQYKDKLASGSSALPKKDFFMVFDQLYSDQPALTAELRSRMRDVYPRLKEVAWGEDCISTLHNLFSSFLSRLTIDCSKLKKAELLDCLVDCLTTDTQSFGVWRQAYTKHLAQSSVLLQHIADNVGSVSVNRKLLYETVRSFHRTNEELAEESVANTKHYQTCVKVCEDLLQKLSAPRFSWKRLFFIVLIALVSVVLYDVYIHGALRKSLTYRTLEEYGVLAFLAHLWNRLLIYCSIIYKWLLVNVPYYYAKASEIIGPYAVLVWVKICSAVTTLANSLHPLYLTVRAKIPTAIQWLEEKLPLVLEFISTYIGVVLTLISNTAVWIYLTISHYAALVWQWLINNVLTGELSPYKIYAAVSAALLSLQSYASRFCVWCASLVK